MAPDRRSVVAEICAQHPEAFPKNDQNDPARLILLRGVIIPTLNANVDDGGNWGLCTKTDLRLPDGSFKVPCDILMWRPDGVLIDCMTGDGPCWDVHPPALPGWVWTAVTPPPAPPPPTPPVPATRMALYVPRTLRAQDELREGRIQALDADHVCLLGSDDRILSVQVDGRLEWRGPGADAIGAWETATWAGSNLLRYDGTGVVWYLAVPGLV
jgi:hypothetical protein